MSALNLFIWLGYFLRTLEAGCVKRKPRTRTEIVSSDVSCAFIYVMLLNSLILLFRSFPPRTQWLQEDLSLRQKWMGKSFFFKKKNPTIHGKKMYPENLLSHKPSQQNHHSDLIAVQHLFPIPKSETFSCSKAFMCPVKTWPPLTWSL